MKTYYVQYIEVVQTKKRKKTPLEKIYEGFYALYVKTGREYTP